MKILMVPGGHDDQLGNCEKIKAQMAALRSTAALRQADVGPRALHSSAQLCAAVDVGWRALDHLQKHHGLDQLEALPPGMRVETLGPDLDAGPDAFRDTAAVMMTLDLIITSDTATAHLAGALARPIWIALSHAPDWSWLLARDDSPWYPTAQLFRQRAARRLG